MTGGHNTQPRCEPWCWNIYLQNWAIFGVDVVKYSIQSGWGPTVISWFINPEIIPINYSYIYHKPLLSHFSKPTGHAIARLGAPSCWASGQCRKSHVVGDGWFRVVFGESHRTSRKLNWIPGTPWLLRVPQNCWINIEVIYIYTAWWYTIKNTGFPIENGDFHSYVDGNDIGWWLSPTPLKNMTSSVGIMKFPMEK